MPKYLFEAKYTPEGVRGLKDAGASSRAKAIGDMAAGLGGSLESFHFAFGDVDAYVIVELPDDEAAAAAAFTVGASTATQVKTVKLLTLEEADAAIGRSVAYRPPGA
ncbi:MAG: GYD domain-containing protein [Acidimicrobiia bacterium]